MDALVDSAVRLANRSNERTVAWGTTRTLELIPQLGFALSQRMRSAEPDQCGASSLVAGLVLQGATATQSAANRLLAATRDLARLFQRTAGDLIYREAREQLTSNVTLLSRLAVLPASQWTTRDLRALSLAVYTHARCDFVTRQPRGVAVAWNGGLQPAQVLALRDLLWSAPHAPSTAGACTMHLIDFADGRHWVLATPAPAGSRAAIVFDPWPQADGSASTIEDRASDRSPAALGPDSDAANRINGGFDIEGWANARAAQGRPTSMTPRDASW